MTEDINFKNSKDAVDAAFEKFGKTRRLSEANEAETRCELIDQILTAIGWECGDFAREVSSGTGDYIDYELPRSSQPRLIVEAKRSGQSFALDETKLETGQTRALSTLLRLGGKLRDALKQAAGYCNDRAIPYACVTNGYQWLFFRGLSSESHSWNEGRVIVFASAKAVVSNFDDFLACLAPHKVNSPELSRRLAKPTSQEIPRSIIPIESLILRRKPVSADLLDIRKAIGLQFFGKIHGGDRPAMLSNCYIEPGDRPDFDRSLQRLLDDTLSGDVFDSEKTYDGSTRGFVDHLQSLDIDGSIKHPILVVGNVGVGKTTFLYRTLTSLREKVDDVLLNEKHPDSKKSSNEKHPDSKKSNAAISAYIDLENQGNLEVFDDQDIQRQTANLILDQLSKSALATLKKRIDISDGGRNEANPKLESTLKTMLHNLLEEERGSAASYFERNPEKWEDTEHKIIQEYRKDSVRLLIHYIRHLRARFKRRDGLKYPILLVLDNLDQASSQYQRCVYGLALRLAKETPAVNIVSIREDTFSEGRHPKGFLSASPLEFVFHVQAPALDQLLRQRVKYINYCVDKGELPTGLKNSSDEIMQVSHTITQGLLNPPRNGLEVISALSGHNIRSALDIVREFISGAALLTSLPEPTVDYMLETLLAIAGQLNHQLDLKKLFDADPHKPPLHALRLRLLGYYSWAYEIYRDRNSLELTETVIAKFAAWGYPTHAVEQALQSLYSQGLLTSIKQEKSDMLAVRMSISSVGYAHIARLSLQKVYRTAMALVTRWYNPDLAQEFIRRAENAGTDSGTSLGDVVVANAVEIFEAYLKTSRVLEDKLLSDKFLMQPWVQETLSRSNSWNVNTAPGDCPKQGALMSENWSEQLILDVIPENKLLPRLPQNLTLHGSVWVPRILWALEYAKVNKLGQVTAAQIATILTREGDRDLPNTNAARAFREFTKKPEIEVYFSRSGKRYSITCEGTAVIMSLIEAEYSDN
jgi:GTPase SAR1 family protein